MAGAELDNWKSSSKLLLLTSAVVAGPPPVSESCPASGGEDAAFAWPKSIRLLECECAWTAELLQLQELKGRSLVAIGEICGMCRSCSRSSPSSQLSIRRMVNT